MYPGAGVTCMSLSKTVAKSLTNYRDPESFGSRLRRKRLLPLLAMIDEVFQEKGSVSIIDIGGTRHYWNVAPRQLFAERNVTVTIVNLPGAAFGASDGVFSYLTADGCDLSAFETQAFDIAHSNSVLEHVGDWSRMKQFAAEVSRVARRYFVQTPSYWFPIEPHCMTPLFHWLPKPIRVWLVRTFNLGHWRRQDTVDGAVQKVESARLLSRSMVQALFQDAAIKTEWLLFPKSYIAIRNR
jgi:hypothetical protein